ncbi:MAG: hypothetical protein ABIO63_00955 [Casimicrobiaceae bacterium]
MSMTKMRPRHLASWILAAGLALAGQSAAQERDRITVKFFPVPHPHNAYEPMEVQLERLRTPASAGSQTPNRLFDQIEQILATHGVTENWQFVLPDGAFIRIKIEIGTRRVELASAHTLYERGGRAIATEQGLVPLDGRDPKQVLAKESETFRSRRIVFERILALISARIRENLGQ